MSGFYAIADPGEPVRTDLDNELEGRWLSVLSILSAAHLALRCQMVHSQRSASRIGGEGPRGFIQSSP